MPYPSRFTPYGMLAYSKRQSHARAIYDTLIQGTGDSLDTDGEALEEARIYAKAMALGSAQYQLDRAGNNRNPLKATELLGLLEQDYQIVPAPDATLPQRRRELAARVRLLEGNRIGAMNAALSLLLGSDFIEYRVCPLSERVVSPYSPASLGAYIAPGYQKKTIRLIAPLLTTGELVTVGYSLLGASTHPQAGERFSFDPDTRSASIESVEIESVDTLAQALTATFYRPHEAGSIGTNSNPAWISSKRYVRIVVTLAAATDPEKRRKINELMRRVARGVTQWEIAHNSGTFISDDTTRGLSECTVMV